MKESVGGQAVIEGVMMQSKQKRAIAVRKENGEIIIEKDKIDNWITRHNIDKIIFIRGAVILIDNMIEGIKSLNFSSDLFLEEEEEEGFIEEFLQKIFKENTSNVLIAISLIISLIIGLGMFVVLPTFLGGLISKVINNTVILNLIEGCIRISIFILYIYIISKNKDVRRVFEYHGAEHKVIHCYENKLELTVKNAAKFNTLHPRCGTNFLFIVMIVYILLLSCFGWPNPIYRIIMRVVFAPIVASISYEIIKILGKYDNKIMNLIAYPGLMLQKLTTKEPDEEQLEVAIKALEAVLE